MRDEELAAARIFPIERHSDRAAQIWQLVQFVTNRIAGSAFPITPRIAVLHDEVRHDAMNRHPVEEPLACQLDEIGDRERSIADGQLDFNGATIGLNAVSY